MKKIVVLLLVVCMCLPCFASCTTLENDDDKGANITMYLTEFPQTLDPASVQLDATSALIFSLIYEPLTTIDSEGNLTGALAKSWYGYYDDRDEIYKMYFELNETYWSDGIQVQAQHVADAWTRILSPDNESPYAAALFPIRNAKAFKAGIETESHLGVYEVNSTLLCVEFEQEYDVDLFAQTVSNIAYAPIRKQVMDYATKQNPVDSKNYDKLQDWYRNAAIVVCNGPFRVQGYEEGTKLVLERNAYYYRDAEEDNLDESVIPYRLTCIYQETVVDETAANNLVDNYTFEYNRYIDGKNYFLGAFNKETYAALKDSISTQDLLSTYTYFFNTTSSVLSNAKVRQALALAIDRNAIVETLGNGMKASTGFVPNGVYDTTAGTDFRTTGGTTYTTDTAKAKSLLSEAGVTSGKIKLTYMIPWSSMLYTKDVLHPKQKNLVEHYNPYEEIANLTKTAWEALGFTVELVPVYADNYAEALSSGEWDVIGVNYAMNSVDALSYLAPFCTTCSGNKVSIAIDSDAFTPHYTGLQSDEYDALIESVLYESDRTKRAEILHNAEKLLDELCPATAIFQYTRSYVASDKLDGIDTDNYYGFYNFNNLTLDNYYEVNSAEAEESVAIASKKESIE